MRKFLLASALACALAPATSFEAFAAAGDAMKTRGTYQSYALRCQLIGRGQTSSIIVFNHLLARVPKGTVIELRTRSLANRFDRREAAHTRVAHQPILRGNGIRVAGVPDARSCSATVKLSPVASLVR
jgi:hypothetical protein